MGGIIPNRVVLTHTLPALTRFGWKVAKEASASFLSFELYPLGMLGERIPVVRSPWTQEKRSPILFIHGIFHNRAAFAYLIQKLALRGWQYFEELNLFTSLHSIPRMAEQTARAVERICSKYAVKNVDIIAHSMGGIIARYFVQRLGGDALVRNIITLGTPHQGTQWSNYSLLPRLRELRPKSALLGELNRCPPPKVAQGLSVYGNLDFCIVPTQSAFWRGVRNIQLNGVGHAGLLFSNRVFRIIRERLGTRQTEKI